MRLQPLGSAIQASKTKFNASDRLLHASFRRSSREAHLAANDLHDMKQIPEIILISSKIPPYYRSFFVNASAFGEALAAISRSTSKRFARLHLRSKMKSLSNSE